MTTIMFNYIDLLHARTRALVEMAREEDLGERGDITSQLIGDRSGDVQFALVARQAGVLAGRLITPDILEMYDRRVELTWCPDYSDGSRFEAGDRLAVIAGPMAAILSAERVLLNFLQRLCAVASATRTYVDAVAGTGAKICDTRKTTPGWRILEKYAVTCGGGRNHRMGLHDAVLIKDNHLAGVGPERLAGTLFSMLNDAAALEPPPNFIEVEADTLDQVEQIFNVVGVDYVLLDNFSTADLAKAVALRDSLGLKGKVQLEASGGITLQTIHAVAESGVERISVGAITHSVPAIDLSLEAI
jgi:nicotinate-nucleotide pyrophosphorylase (carboxylating)